MSATTTTQLPWVPAGQDPELYDGDRVQALLQSAAYFPIFNVANPAFPNHPNLLIPGVPLFFTSVDVNEQLHRFQTVTGQVGRELRASKRVGEAVAKVGIQWTPIPDYYAPVPGGTTPTWILNPLISQRFTMLKGHLDFQDAQNSGVHAFGVGRTFPVVEGGKQRLRIAASIEVLEGLGRLQGLQGAFTIIGYIEPPDNLALHLMVRMMDPAGKLRAQSDSPITPIQAMPDPDPDAVFMILQGQPDTSKHVEPILSADRKIVIGRTVRERLRLVHFDFDLSTPAGLRSLTKEGSFVGTLETNLYFDTVSTATVTPIQTTDGIFTFSKPDGETIGTISINLVEGRAIVTKMEGFQMPLFRMVGLGPVLRGTGQFEGAEGMMVMNGVVSAFPRAASNLYIFRFYDPEGKINAAWSDMSRYF